MPPAQHAPRKRCRTNKNIMLTDYTTGAFIIYFNHMYKGNDIIGKPIIAYDTGAIIEQIKDVLFDGPKKKILGFLVGEEGVFSKAKILPFSSVKSIGKDAVTIDGDQAIIEAKKDTRLEALAESDNVARGTKVITEDGKDLGAIADLYFDESSGDITGYEVSGGVFADAYSGKSFLPAPQTLKIGEDVAFVPAETAQLMEEQVGGIRGAMQQMAGQAGEIKDVASGRMHEVLADAREYAGQAGQALTEKSMETMVGRRLHRSVYADNGSIIGAAGQIVTPEIISMTRAQEKEAELMAAIALPEGDAGIDSMQQGASSIGQSLTHAWDRIKEKTAEITEQTGAKVEQQRIEAAIGKPVTRVILDEVDNVILNTGEIITHESVEQARQGNALGMLLDSVATDKPHFSSEELKSKTLNEE